jgi:hypothetical protein
MKPIISIVLFAALCTSSGFAQSVTKDSQQSWNEIKKQNAQYLKELKEKDPATWNRLRAQDILDAQEALASFGYGTVFTATLDDKAVEALLLYQKRSGLPVTGDVDTATVQRLTEDKAELGRHIPLGPIYTFTDPDWDNLVTIEGTRVEQGKELDARTTILPTRVECLKSTGSCIVATQTSEGSEYIHLEWFEVQRWDAYEIVTKPCDLPCGRETMHINRPSKTVLLINSSAYKNVEACTKLFGPAGADSVVRLDDGRKIINARVKAFRAASNRIKLISAEAQNRIGP